VTEGFRARLLSGERLLGTLVSLPVPELAEIAADSGFDWLFLDMEHGRLEAGSLTGLIQAAGPACPCLVRVPANEEMWAKKALDSGAAGVIVPRVNTAEEAARAVHWSKFPPRGGRSVGFSRANRYGARFQEHVDTANDTLAVIPQVEHIDGVREINEILGVPGIDAVFIGPYDLSASLGKPGRIGDSEVAEAISAVRSACARKGVPAGVFAGDATAGRKALAEGFSLVCCGIDISLFARTASAIVQVLRKPVP
jgi:2-dehydro-3-deoxyglucarate aldolase